ncbi:hypothetical protein HanPSC8_Chr09g0375811 [Helianthus annuus]|nr:hypothetical protein HanPSC8_Chr09g0375811 [Helianthus annuus]
MTSYEPGFYFIKISWIFPTLCLIYNLFCEWNSVIKIQFQHKITILLTERHTFYVSCVMPCSIVTTQLDIPSSRFPNLQLQPEECLHRKKNMGYDTKYNREKNY